MAQGIQVEGRTFLKKIDWSFAIVILGLNIIGLINLYSATHGMAAAGTDRLFFSQIFWLAAGWIVYFFMTLIDYQFFARLSYLIYALNLSALLAVIFVGKIALGAQRWLDLGFFSYQPSESMKLSMILLLSRVMSQKSYPDGLGLKDLIIPLLFLIGAPFVITAAQPDLGTAMMLGIIGVSILFFLKIQRRILIIVTLGWVSGWDRRLVFCFA